MKEGHWNHIFAETGIDVQTVEDMDKAFNLDMGRGSKVDGDYSNYKSANSKYMFYDELTPEQKGKFLEAGLTWDRIGRIGDEMYLLPRQEVLELLK